MVIRVNFKNTYLNNYSDKLFRQANCFNFQSNHDSLFVNVQQCIIRLLSEYITTLSDF